MSIIFNNSYTELPEHFYTRMHPSAVTSPGLIRINEELCDALQIDTHWLRSSEGIDFLAGNFIPESAEPIATVYAGHQFGHWNPQLGDGRAILMGEVVDRQGQRFDIQLKGSGPTPYSRGGDGRAPLGAILREYIVSEAMFALGVPTSRSLAAVTTGEKVYRDEPQAGAIIARVAQSHIRIGTFQFFAARKDISALKELSDHVINRHYQTALKSDKPVAAMFEQVIQREANLVAHWLSIGFIHGVMNTDNILLSGETIDYGPCAFIDDFHPDRVYSSIDHNGRYAYSNQTQIMHWNLSALVQALLPLLDDNPDDALGLAQTMIDGFPNLAKQAYLEKMTRKLGLSQIKPEDELLIQDLLDLMQDEALDFTLTFRNLPILLDSENQNEEHSGIHDRFKPSEKLAPWTNRWRQRLEQDGRSMQYQVNLMNTVNPIYIPRNHLVEDAITMATKEGDYKPFNTLVELLKHPFDFDKKYSSYALPPRPEQVVENTFCGT